MCASQDQYIQALLIETTRVFIPKQSTEICSSPLACRPRNQDAPAPRAVKRAFRAEAWPSMVTLYDLVPMLPST